MIDPDDTDAEAEAEETTPPHFVLEVQDSGSGQDSTFPDQ